MTEKKDDRVQIRMPTELKKLAKIKALELGYGTGKGSGISEYINDLIKKDLEKQN